MYKKRRRFYADWRDEQGARRRKSFITAKAAEDHEAERKAEARANVRRSKRERILLQFSPDLLERADKAALAMQTSRSVLIQTAAEQLLNRMERARLGAELADAYRAHAAMNLELAAEFEHLDHGGNRPSPENQPGTVIQPLLCLRKNHSTLADRGHDFAL